MGLYEDLKNIEPFSLSCHDDADGVYSASILCGMFKIKTIITNGDNMPYIKFPPFNEYDTDVAVDLGYPINSNFKGIIIDHHVEDYPQEVLKNPNIKLYLDNVPTGLILWRQMKEHIPKELWFRVAGSLIGDGQPELIPDEIWDAYPELLDEKGTVYRATFGSRRLAMSKYPLYMYLSSGVNALCRLGNPLGALRMCLEWRSPIDAVLSGEAEEAKQLLRVETANILKSNPVVEIIRNRFAVVKIKSTRDYGMSGAIASELSSQYKFYTIVVINETNGEVSIRGVLAKYLANKLKEIGFKAGGHYGFAGATVPVGEIENFIKVIRGI